jgi:hypothetical protein
VSLRESVQILRRAERGAVLWFGEMAKRHLYRELGYASIQQYASTALRFSKAKTSYFLRLCGVFEELPALKNSVQRGEIGWTKAREVAKVATPRTERSWIDTARSCSRRELEQQVAAVQQAARQQRRRDPRQAVLPVDRGRTGGPTGVGGAAAVVELPAAVTLRFAPDQLARYETLLERIRKLRALPRGAGREDLLLAGLEGLLAAAECGAEVHGTVSSASVALEAGASDGNNDSAGDSTGDSAGASAGESVGESGSKSAGDRGNSNPTAASRAAGAGFEPKGNARGAQPGAEPAHPFTRVNARTAMQPRYQIVVHRCKDCRRTQVRTSRGWRDLGPAAAEAVLCDARFVQPGHRSRTSISPSVRREVMVRDGFCCRAPGCGSRWFLEVHHLIPRSKGGSSEPGNLVTLCARCHRYLHEHSGEVVWLHTLQNKIGAASLSGAREAASGVRKLLPRGPEGERR